MQLKNKRALVTAAGKGPGRAIALRLAAVGMDVALHCHSSAEHAQETSEQIAQFSVKSLVAPADLRDSQQIETMLDRIQTDLGPIDVLVNNAAVFLPTSLDDFQPEVWQEIFEVNVFAPAILSHRIGRHMKSRGAGKIINILDITAERPFATHAAYCASKAALASLTKSWAKALAPEVQVNGVAPGIMDWPDFFTEAQRRSYVQNTPLGRTGAYDDVATTVLFLVKESAFVTGQVIKVDGGRSL
ncbi:MAG: SDR family oxidoreductase [Actinobacteria bacterium]|nr:SDR family oxidoreductase [Actinomycetota bacterium]